jgi:riboflavin transporter FmnP
MKTRRIIFMGLLIACSFIGANLRIFSSVALDSMPAFLGALLLGPLYGGIIGAVGHLITAVNSGFPMGLPTHVITMFSMFVAVYLFGKVQISMSDKFNRAIGIVLGTIAAVLFNGPMALLLVVPILGIGILALAPVISIAAAINVVFAQIVYVSIPAIIKNKYKGLWEWR